MESSFYSAGGMLSPDGNIYVDNQTITQVVYLLATNPNGTALTKVKVWFAGNGVDSYQVQSASLQQGTVSVSVKVNGASSFLIPAMGRWSDYASTTSFTLPGNVNFVTVVKLKVPIVYPVDVGDFVWDESTGLWTYNVSADGDGDQAGVSNPGIVIGTDQRITSEVSYLICNWEGADGTYDFSSVDEAQGQAGSYPSDGHVVFSTSKYYSGTSSLRMQLLEHNFEYNNIPNLADATQFALSFFYLRNDVLRQSTEKTEVYLRAGGSNYTSLEFVLWGPTVVDGPTGTITIKGYNTANVLSLDYSGSYSIPPANEWQKVEIRVNNNTVTFLHNDETISTSTISSISGINDLWVYNTTASHSPAMYTYFDSLRIDNTGDSQALPDFDRAEVDSTFTITVSDNTLVTAGDTITITQTNPVDGEITTEAYTFVDVPTGAENEIVIGLTDDITASNIADALDLTDGAYIDGTATAEVVDVTVTSSDDVVVTTDSSGITIGTVTKEITYTSASATSSLPAFEASSTGFVGADLGDYYVNATLAPLTATGTMSMTGINGNAVMPAFTARGNSFVRGLPTALTDEQKVAMLMDDNAWMEWLASLIAIPGDYDDVALLATQWVANNITYATDLATWGVADYWIDPRATIYYGVGDSEDGALLIASIIINSGVPEDRVRVYTGETLGVAQTWVMYQRDIDNQWVVLDWTDGATEWNAVSNIDDLTPIYPTIKNIFDLDLNTDDYEYGIATEYITQDGVVTLSYLGEYLDSLYANASDTELEQNIPSLTIIAYGGGQLVEDIPLVTVSSTGTVNPTASLTRDIPRITIDALAWQEGIGTLSVNIPAITLVSGGTISPTASLNRDIPGITIEASGIAGFVASLEKSIGAITLSGSSVYTGDNGNIIYIPAVDIYARARGTVTTLCMNTKNSGLTKYSSFDYNSMCIFNGEMLMAKRTGIYKSTGTEDDDTTIDWSVKTGLLDLKTNKLRHVWLSGKLSNDIKMIVETADGDAYEYDIEPSSEYEDETRVKVGKGLGAKYLSIELKNESPETITLDKMNIYGMPGSRK